jgi:hypothetical protein
MNGGLVSGNSALSGPGIAVNKGNASFEMNGGLVDNGVNGVLLFNNSSDTDCNGALVLNAGTVSGVTVHSNVAFGNNTPGALRNLYFGEHVTVNSAYIGAAGRQVTPLSAKFNIGNPNTASYANIRSALPEGWAIPATNSNVIAFWLNKPAAGAMIFSVPVPTGGTAPAAYDPMQGAYFAAVLEAAANGAAAGGAGLKLYPALLANGQILVSLPLGAYPHGATVALAQPASNFGVIEFEGPPALLYDYSATAYQIPYTAAYEMPPGLQALLHSDGHDNDNSRITLYIRPAPQTVPDISSFTLISELFEPDGFLGWDPASWVLEVPLKFKDNWQTAMDLSSGFTFSCAMEAADFADGGRLFLSGEIVIAGLNGKTYHIHGNYAHTDMIKSSGNGNPANPPPLAAKQGTAKIPNRAEERVTTVSHIAYIVGYPGGTVGPERSITRAEAAMVFFRLTPEEIRAAYQAEKNPFSDTQTDSWYNNAVSLMAGMGIVKGYPDGTFRPGRAIFRAELAAMAARFARKMDMPPLNDSRFSDIAGHWAEADIQYAAAAGWVNGYPDGTFKPGHNITRAEFMTLVNRMLERVLESEEDLLNEEMISWPDNANAQAWYYLAVQEATNSHLAEYTDKPVPGLRFNYEFWVKMLEPR